MSTPAALTVSILLLAANGFFVAAEFALVASRGHRLKEAAIAGSRAARAALSGTQELSLMLAGAQLGITLCSLGLGSLAEPAIAHALDPLLHDAGLPEQSSHVVAFLISLALVVFLHMVVGEMAPKSWAISHPERSATLLALPFRAFTKLAHPLLVVLNKLANAFVRICGIEPQDELAQAHGPADLQMLLEQSREHGLLPAPEHQMLTRVLRLQQTTVREVMISRSDVVAVALRASCHEVERVSAETGRSRLAVVNTSNSIVGVLHVRDAVRASTNNEPCNARQIMARAFAIPPTDSVAQAIAKMRLHRVQLAIVKEGSAEIGVVALEDLLEELLGEFDDETDVDA